MLNMCSQCLADTNYVQDGHDEQGRKFKLYHCPNCKSYVRDFYLSERETVEEAIYQYMLSLVQESQGAKPKQLPLFHVSIPRVMD